jgi:hypothetical protein
MVSDFRVTTVRSWPTLLQKRFIVSAGNLSVVLASESGTLSRIQKNEPFFLSAAIDQYRRSMFGVG